jgi:hypothetical protein
MYPSGRSPRSSCVNAGILQKTGDGLIIFPYDAIRVDIMLRAA